MTIRKHKFTLINKAKLDQVVQYRFASLSLIYEQENSIESTDIFDLVPVKDISLEKAIY